MPGDLDATSVSSIHQTDQNRSITPHHGSSRPRRRSVLERDHQHQHRVSTIALPWTVWKATCENDSPRPVLILPSSDSQSSRKREQINTVQISNHGHGDPAYLWSSLAAGVGSGALSSILCAPIDLLRTRLQVWGQVVTVTEKNKTVHSRKTPAISTIPRIVRDIVRQEGFRGLFRGLGATLMTVPIFWGVYFPLYDDLKRYLGTHYATPNTPAALIHMISAVSAGAVSDVICNPMFVVRTRLQTEALHHLSQSQNSYSSPRPTSLIKTARALYQEGGGVIIFWRGMSANLLGLSHVAVQFPIYEQLKLVLKHDKPYESSADLLLASSLSKMTASLLTYPHEVMRSRMMDTRGQRSMTLLQVCRTIYRSEGWLGFYAGLPVSLIRVLPNTCVTFLSYELILRSAWTKIRRDRYGDDE